MYTLPDPTADEELLGRLAMQFRGTRCDAERQRIVQEYAATVTRLVNSGRWLEVPPPEDQLPDEHMPAAYFEHWQRRAS